MSPPEPAQRESVPEPFNATASFKELSQNMVGMGARKSSNKDIGFVASGKMHNLSGVGALAKSVSPRKGKVDTEAIKEIIAAQ